MLDGGVSLVPPTIVARLLGSALTWSDDPDRAVEAIGSALEPVQSEGSRPGAAARGGSRSLRPSLDLLGFA